MLPDRRFHANSKGCSGHTRLHSTKVGLIVGTPVGKYICKIHLRNAVENYPVPINTVQRWVYNTFAKCT